MICYLEVSDVLDLVNGYYAQTSRWKKIETKLLPLTLDGEAIMSAQAPNLTWDGEVARLDVYIREGY